MHKVLLIVGLVILLVACTQPEPTSTPTPAVDLQATIEALRAEPTPTIVVIATSTPTPTPTNTPTPVPTATPTPVPTATPTPIPNSPPVIVRPGNKVYEQGESIDPVDVTVTDSDDTPIVTVNGLPPGLSYGFGQIVGTVASNAFVRDYTVTITASDGSNVPVLTSFIITVRPIPNSPPVIVNPVNKVYEQGESIDPVDVTVTDSDDTPTVTVTGLPDGLSYMSGQIVGTVDSVATVRDYRVAIIASDGSNSTVATFIITVRLQSIPVGVGHSPIAAGGSHTCGLQADGTVVCWGDDAQGQSSPRAGQFISISAGYNDTCALRADGSAACWGSGDDRIIEILADDRFVFLDLNSTFDDECGLRADGSAFCWEYRRTTAAPNGVFTAITAGDEHACALQENGTAVCWGDEDAQQDRPDEKEQYIAIGVGNNFTCALRLDGSAVCWGLDNKWKNAAPQGEEFAFLSTGDSYACALRKKVGTGVCWDEDGVIRRSDRWRGNIVPPADARFTHITVGWGHICGVLVDGTPVCWGENDDGESSPPAGIRLATPEDTRRFSMQRDALIQSHRLPSQVSLVSRSVVRIEAEAGSWRTSLGTGVIVSVDEESGEALVVTAYHVIEDRTGAITVTAGDAANVREYEAEVVRSAPAQDVVLLSICCSPTFQAAEMADHFPERGDSVFVLGYGRHKGGMAIAAGEVVGVRDWDGVSDIGTNAGVHEGDSGSPLMGENGQVFGIMLSVVRFGLLWPDGTGLAVSSVDVVRLLGLADQV